MLADDGIRRFMVICDDVYPPDAVDFPADRQRQFYRDLCARFSPARPAGLAATDSHADGPAGPVPIRIYRPRDAGTPPVMLYLHGGGFIVGDLDSHDSICAEIADQAGIAVIAVDYRLAPEHRFPTAFDDCRAVLTALPGIAAEHDLDAARLVVGGDSAGANLSAALCLHARDNDGPAIAGQVLIYPGLGGDMTTGSYVEHAEAPGLTSADVHYYREIYLGSAGQDNKYARPLLETNYAGLPPAFLVAAEFDPLRDDAFTYGDRLKAAGVPALVRHEPLLVHAFLRARHMSEPARESFAAIVAATRSLAHDGHLSP
jgi:acetyl esterase